MVTVSIMLSQLTSILEDTSVLTIPKTRFDQFRHHETGKRYGQAFYDFMQFEKITNEQDKAFVEKLYQEPDREVARSMIFSRLDHEN